MLRQIGENIRNYLKATNSFRQIDYYEGQFEKLDEVTIIMPACFIDYESGTDSISDQLFGSIDFRLYLITSALLHNPGNMLDIIEDCIQALHKKPVTFENGDTVEDGKSGYIGRLFYKEFRRNTTYPGMVVWEAVFRVER
jgi:hypothetical protein